DRVFSYVGIALEERRPVEDRYRIAVTEAVAALGISGVVAVEAQTLTALVADVLADAGARRVLVDRELDRARSVKTPAEIECLRFCAHLTDLGQAAALEGARAGRTELEIWADVRLAMEQEVGERVPVAGDLTSGVKSTAAISGWPTDRVLQEGDPVLV